MEERIKVLLFCIWLSGIFFPGIAVLVMNDSLKGDLSPSGPAEHDTHILIIGGHSKVLAELH